MITNRADAPVILPYLSQLMHRDFFSCINIESKNKAVDMGVILAKEAAVK